MLNLSFPNLQKQVVMKLFAMLMVFLPFIGVSQNLLVNPSFEDWDNGTSPSGWVLKQNVSKDSMNAIHLDYCAAQINNTGTSKVSQTISGLIPGDTVTIRLRYKVSAGDGADARIWSSWRSGSNNTTHNKAELQGPNTGYLPNNGGAWSSYSVTLVIPVGVDGFVFEVRSYSGATVYWDDFAFEVHQTSCDLSIYRESVSCLEVTSGVDTFEAVYHFTNGGQGVGTYNISPMALGDDPDVDTSGQLVFRGIEGDTLFISITSDSCSFTDTVMAPMCSPPMPCPDAGSVIFSELMADPTGNDNLGEYIELYNRSPDTIDLIGYRLSDLGSDLHTLSSHLYLPPNQFLVMSNSSSYPYADYVYGGDITMANNSDQILLHCQEPDSSYKLMSSVSYSNGAPFGAGASMELLCTNQPNYEFSDIDFGAGTDPFTYAGITGSCYGSPGYAGNTDTAAVTPYFLIGDAPDMVIYGETVEVTICASDSMYNTPCGWDASVTLTQISGPSVVISPSTVTAYNGCAAFTVELPAGSGCEVLIFDAYADTLHLTESLELFVFDKIAEEDFSSCANATWHAYNVQGSNIWECDSTSGTMSMNAYGDTEPISDQWLISSPIDLIPYHQPYMTFYTRERFSGSTLSLYYSTDYIGSGDPSVATWMPIAFALDTSQNGFAFGPWIFSDFVALDDAIDSSAYLAFRYYTADTDNAGEWLLKDIQIGGCVKSCLFDSVYLENVSACDTSNSQFTADVVIRYHDAPYSGQLILSGDVSDTIAVGPGGLDPDSTSYILMGVSMAADGALKTIYMQFTADTTCQYAAIDLVNSDVPPCGDGPSIYGGLIINEVWNDRSYTGATCISHESYIELLVTAHPVYDSTATRINLGGWMIDASVNDIGHLRIKNGCLNDVPVGSLLVLYNPDNIAAGISGPDESDSNMDSVYFIPVNSSCIEYSTTTGYPSATYTSADDMSCTPIWELSGFSSNLPYQARTISPIDSQIFMTMTYDPISSFPSGSASLICGNVHDLQAVEQDYTLTPGLPNANENEALVEALKTEASGDLDAVSYFHLFASGLMVACDDIVIPDCRDTLILSGIVVGVSDTLFASQVIITEGVTNLEGQLTLSAPMVILRPGFTIETPHVLQIDQTGCSHGAMRSSGHASMETDSADLDHRKAIDENRETK